MAQQDSYCINNMHKLNGMTNSQNTDAPKCAPCEAVTLPHPLQRVLEKVARLRRPQILGPVIATERKEMKAPCVFVSDESARHRWKA